MFRRCVAVLTLFAICDSLVACTRVVVSPREEFVRTHFRPRITRAQLLTGDSVIFATHGAMINPEQGVVTGPTDAGSTVALKFEEICTLEVEEVDPHSLKPRFTTTEPEMLAARLRQWREQSGSKITAVTLRTLDVVEFSGDGAMVDLQRCVLHGKTKDRMQVDIRFADVLRVHRREFDKKKFEVGLAMFVFVVGISTFPVASILHGGFLQ